MKKKIEGARGTKIAFFVLRTFCHYTREMVFQLMGARPGEPGDPLKSGLWLDFTENYQSPVVPLGQTRSRLSSRVRFTPGKLKSHFVLETRKD